MPDAHTGGVYTCVCVRACVGGCMCAACMCAACMCAACMCAACVCVCIRCSGTTRSTGSLIDTHTNEIDTPIHMIHA